MPSEKILEQKKQIVSDLADTLSSSVAGVIVDYKGITVEDDTKLRKDLREAGVKYAVVKNTILKLAAEKAELSDIDDVLEGTTAIATSAEDYTAAARILCKFASTSKTFTVKKGFLDGREPCKAAFKGRASCYRLQRVQRTHRRFRQSYAGSC